MMNSIRKLRADDSAQTRRSLTHLFDEYRRAEQERDEAGARMGRYAETIKLLLTTLPAQERAIFQSRFLEMQDGGTVSARGGEAFGRIISLVRTAPGRVWSISEFQNEISKGDVAQQKAVYNAINYLTQSGRLKRVARGQYVASAIGVGLDYDGPDDGTARISEHDS